MRQETERLQALLNKVGGLLEVDGLAGPATRRATAEARALAGLAPGERPDAALLAWLEAQPKPSPLLPTRGVAFIAREEVGGRAYYDSHGARPCWPGGASGITIGVGYDLRFARDLFEGDWGRGLPTEVLAALRPQLGRRGSRKAAEALSWIRIPWSLSWQVYVGRSLPLQVERTRRAYAGLEALPGLCRAVLVSLVFNRGPRMSDPPGRDRRREMRAIRDLLQEGRPEAVPAQLLSMRRLWPAGNGLRDRRAREAALWEEGLASGDDGRPPSPSAQLSPFRPCSAASPHSSSSRSSRPQRQR